jgi:hypothetical protein
MRKLALLAALAGAGALLVRRLRSPGAAPARPTAPAPQTPVAAPAPAAAPVAAPSATPPVEDPAPPATGPPPPTTNGERVVLMAVQSLEDGGGEVTREAVVGKVGAGELDPDEGTVDVLLHRLATAGCLDDSGNGGPYRLTAVGRAALLDGSSARPSPAGDAGDELASPATEA